MLSISSGVQEYIQAMVDRISGMKVLILDNETIGIISMVFSQSKILQHEVFLVERLDADAFFAQEEKMRHMNAICFLRPTHKNFIKLIQELQAPKYNEYHVFFTNVVPHPRLEQLAVCDEFEVVQQVQEFFADVYAVGHDLFTLNLPSTARLTEDPGRFTSYEESVLERTVEGLLSVCLTLRLMPVIRYTASSDLTFQVAHKLQTRIVEEQSLFDSMDRDRRGDLPAVLLLADRRNDPVTPLLNQWTYQAMLHELLGIENNRIDMSSVPGIRQELEMIVMSSSQDKFFEDNMYSNFGDLGVNIRKYVEDYQRQTKSTAKIESVEEMQQFVDQYPEFRKLAGNVSKHVAVVHELSRVVEANGLLEASQLEQAIACSENRQEHFRSVSDILRSTNITNMERLRLVLLYALRYESDTQSIQALKEQLRGNGIGQEQVSLVDQLLRYAGLHARTGDLFQNKTIFNVAKSVITSNLRGVDNVYTQHKSQLATVIDNLLRGRLKEANYPFTDGCRYAQPVRDPVQQVIVFVIGGTTYEEARDVAEINRTAEGGRSVILGGTTIHNSRTFLTDVAQLGARMGPE